MIARPVVPSVRTKFAESVVKVSEDKKSPRRKPVYPISAERELARAFLEVSQSIIKESKPFIDRLMSMYEEEDVRQDAVINLKDGIWKVLRDYSEAITKALNIKRIIRNTSRAGKTARSISIRDWKALVDDALGEDISEPFYVETTEDLLNKWVGESVSHITTLPQEYLGKVHEAIMWGYNTHQPKVNVYKRIMRETGATLSQSRMIARDQMGTLNARMTQYEHESMGVTHYKWVTKRDSRVRECHRQLDGQVFRWTNPPAMWYSTISRGIVYTGRYCNPGEDYGCRCVASPVFDEDIAKGAIMKQRARKKR